MKLYVDDIRDVPDESWTLARTITEAIAFIAMFKNQITDISLDHDISHEIRVNGVYRPFPSPDNFTPVAYFIGEVYENQFDRPNLVAHTANPAGGEKIRSILEQYGVKCEVILSPAAHRKK